MLIIIMLMNALPFWTLLIRKVHRYFKKNGLPQFSNNSVAFFLLPLKFGWNSSLFSRDSFLGVSIQNVRSVVCIISSGRNIANCVYLTSHPFFLLRVSKSVNFTDFETLKTFSELARAFHESI